MPCRTLNTAVSSEPKTLADVLRLPDLTNGFPLRLPSSRCTCRLGGERLQDQSGWSVDKDKVRVIRSICIDGEIGGRARCDSVAAGEDLGLVGKYIHSVS